MADKVFVSFSSFNSDKFVDCDYKKGAWLPCVGILLHTGTTLRHMYTHTHTHTHIIVQNTKIAFTHPATPPNFFQKMRVTIASTMFVLLLAAEQAFANSSNNDNTPDMISGAIEGIHPRSPELHDGQPGFQEGVVWACCGRPAPGPIGAPHDWCEHHNGHMFCVSFFLFFLCH